MSDEAFARRFYSDRAELIALGVPLHSQRDEFTGEELYTLRSENYFLDKLELDDDELAALQTALYMLDGHVRVRRAAPARAPEPRARPARLRRRADRDGAERPGARSRLLAGDGGPALEARVRDLEAAHDQVQLLVAAPRRRPRALAEPVRAPARPRHLVRRRRGPRPRRRAHVPRLADPQRHPLRDAPRARLPRCLPTSTSTPTGSARTGSTAPVAGTARIEVNGDTAWWVHRTLQRGRDARPTGSSRRTMRRSSRSPAGCCARTAARSRSSPRTFGAHAPRGSERVREAHEAEPPKPARPKSLAVVDGRDRAAGAAGGSGALRRPPGAARLSARRLR